MPKSVDGNYPKSPSEVDVVKKHVVYSLEPLYPFTEAVVSYLQTTTTDVIVKIWFPKIRLEYKQNDGLGIPIPTKELYELLMECPVSDDHIRVTPTSKHVKVCWSYDDEPNWDLVIKEVNAVHEYIRPFLIDNP